ncbi:uncharacterized protein LOC5517079 isoform X1 [Nematostella vectensis]|uniref:uncharacterized protein LOC5517079 isoform X1 n=2 Tax=Nematostella vectensis TaxID=45351 RepID=UPI00138FD253|nr:uncharacterized protein LOC5517079 isoform X1 [Nematostella vectensis]
MGTSQSSYVVSPTKKTMDEKEEDPPLGMQTCAIPPYCITSSSCADATPAYLARLHGAHAWCAGDPTDCFIEVDLQTVHHVTAVATQGNPSGNHDYVMRYKVQYSEDGETWCYYTQGDQEELDANSDHCSAVKRVLEPAISARYVRVCPTVWFQWPCLRLELYGRPVIDKPSEELTKTAGLQTQQENDEKEIRGQGENSLPGEDKASSIDGKKEDLNEEENKMNKKEMRDEDLESPMSDIEANSKVCYDSQRISDSGLQQIRGPALASDDFRRLLEVKKRLEFEAELRTLQEEKKVDFVLRRKKKKVTYDLDSPDLFNVPRRVYTEMWGGDSPGESVERIDKSVTDDKPMIERGNVGAPLANLDDEDLEPARRTVITIRTVFTISNTQQSPTENGEKRETSFIQPVSADTSYVESEDSPFTNGYDEQSRPSRASCAHLHATDPAAQTAMESSFHERLDSIESEGMSPLDLRRFSGLDLLQTPLNAVSDDDIERLIAWEDEALTGWHRVKKSRDLEICRGQAVDGGPPIIKATMTLRHISYDQARRRIMNWDVRMEWDKTFDDVIILDRTYHFNVIHCSIKRQGLTLAILEDIDPDEPYHACVWKVTDFPDYQPASPCKMLKYETMMSGLVIRPIDNGSQSSKVTLLCQVKGSVSQPLRNTFLTGSPEKWLEMLKKYDPKPKVIKL